MPRPFPERIAAVAVLLAGAGAGVACGSSLGISDGVPLGDASSESGEPQPEASDVRGLEAGNDSHTDATGEAGQQGSGETGADAGCTPGTGRCANGQPQICGSNMQW